MLEHHYQPVGSCLELFYDKSPEVLLSGAAGTGKSRGCLEKLHLLAQLYPRMRGLIVRKTQESLTKSTLVTFQNYVALEALESGEVRFYGGSAKEPTHFRYANGSTITTGGMDKASRIMSTEFDIIFVEEATELAEDDWEKLTTRLRNNVMPYQQIIAACNPSYPTHWLKQREKAGKTHFIYCRHEDNLVYYNNGNWTELGLNYLKKLDELSGVNKERLRYGRWAAAEGLIYDTFDPNVHIYSRKTPFGAHNRGDWSWYWSVDFGFVNPFVCQQWAVDSDSRLYLYREIYMTERTVEEHCLDLKRFGYGPGSFKIPRPKAVICDSADPEGMEVIRKKLKVSVVKANKDVSRGIQLVKERLRVQPDGKPRLYICSNSLLESDRELASKHLPSCTQDEVLAYTWNPKKPDEPLKKYDHGMDAMRYMVSYLDNKLKPNVRFINF